MYRFNVHRLEALQDMKAGRKVEEGRCGFHPGGAPSAALHFALLQPGEVTLQERGPTRGEGKMIERSSCSGLILGFLECGFILLSRDCCECLGKARAVATVRSNENERSQVNAIGS